MKSRRTKQFQVRFLALPDRVRQQANNAYRLFKANPARPGLDFKQVSKEGPTYSARIGIHYRALAVRKSEHWLWFWIGAHAEYDKLLDQLP
ncbi:MAG: hypothetical protein OJF49_003841 [Ktedonobacterales bacterium]|nr:MAG: hypothetical protein OJF49_003841 [Ktedonobacterales bacterium]